MDSKSGPGLGVRRIAVAAARFGPWVIFGPITGLMSEAAIRCFRRGRWGLGVLWLALNLFILLALPLTTALLAARI
jgi:hypothetical protein